MFDKPTFFAFFVKKHKKGDKMNVVIVLSPKRWGKNQKAEKRSRETCFMRHGRIPAKGVHFKKRGFRSIFYGKEEDINEHDRRY